MSRTQTMAAFVSIWILTVSFVVPVPTVKALTAVGSITLSGEVNPKSALIDTVNGFAYFGTENSTFPLGSPGVIVKIRLSDFSLAGTLNLEPGQTPLHAAVIDTANGFAYFATGRIPSAIVKIRLSDFTLAASLTLGKGEDEIQAAVIDVANGFAYFAGHNATAGVSPQTIIVKVRLSDFTQVGTLKLSPEGFPYSATIDTTNGFAYVGEQIGVLPGVIVRVRLSDFTSTGVLSLNPGEALPLSAVIDSANGFAYFGTGNFTGPVVPPGIIVKVRLSDFTRGGALTLNPGEVLPTSAVIDIARGFAFFGTYTFPGTIVEVRLSDFTRVEAITLNPSTEGGLTSAVIDAAMGFAYYGGGHNIMRVATAPRTFAYLPI